MINVDDISSSASRETLAKEITRLERLLADLRHISEYGQPDDVSLHVAPLLDRWSISYTAAVCLVGYSTGHPILPGSNRYIATSDVCAISEHGNWARTRSRYYRLGSTTTNNPRLILT